MVRKRTTDRPVAHSPLRFYSETSGGCGAFRNWCSQTLGLTPALQKGNDEEKLRTLGISGRHRARRPAPGACVGPGSGGRVRDASSGALAAAFAVLKIVFQEYYRSAPQDDGGRDDHRT